MNTVNWYDIFFFQTRVCVYAPARSIAINTNTGKVGKFRVFVNSSLGPDRERHSGDGERKAAFEKN